MPIKARIKHSKRLYSLRSRNVSATPGKKSWGEKKEIASTRVLLSLRRLWLHLGYRCQYHTYVQLRSQEPELYHLFQLWPARSLCDHVFWTKERTKKHIIMEYTGWSPIKRCNSCDCLYLRIKETTIPTQSYVFVYRYAAILHDELL